MTDIVVHGRQIQRARLADLKDYERNARTHDEAQIAAMVAIMRDSGFTSPILVDPDNVIIAGHGRAIAAARVGMDEVPVIRISGLDPGQIRRLRISDNALGLRAEWDIEALRYEVAHLQEVGFDMTLTGFELGELQDLVDGNRVDPDDAKEPPREPVSVLGDVWILGDHRICCGDCTDPIAVAAALQGAKPHLMVTDPPYGVSYDAAWRAEKAKEGKVARRGKTKPKNASEGAVLADDVADWSKAWALFEGDVAYVWHAALHEREAFEALIAAGFQIRAQIIWRKPTFAISQGHYHWAHEPCAYAVRRGATGHWEGGRKQSTLWSIQFRMGYHKGGEGDGRTGHSTQKPVEAMRRPMLNNSRPGQAVYDPFLGSGTTIIAAEMTGRRCFGLELHPGYVDVAVERWEAFTGRQAVHAATGETFATEAIKRQLVALSEIARS